MIQVSTADLSPADWFKRCPWLVDRLAMMCVPGRYGIGWGGDGFGEIRKLWGNRGVFFIGGEKFQEFLIFFFFEISGLTDVAEEQGNGVLRDVLQ